MNFIYYVLVLLVVIKTIDILFTRIFAVLARRHYLQREEVRKEANADCNETYDKDPFIRSVLVSIYNFYEGWTRYKIRGIGRCPFQNLRKFVLRSLYGMKIGNNAVIYGDFEIRDPWNITIGTGTIIGDGAKLDGRRGLIIGNNVNLSTGVWIWSEQHSIDDPSFKMGAGGMVEIENRVWVSSRVSILPGVHISEGAVIASSAVVTKDCDSFSVYAGIPARKIKERNKELNYKFDGSFLPFA